MKVMTTLVFSATLVAGFAGIAHAADAPSGDAAAYKQKLHDCQAQMKTDHPDMNHEARRKACRKELGPMPKSSTASPAAPPPPPGESSAPPVSH